MVNKSTLQSEVWRLRCVVKTLVSELDIEDRQKKHLMDQLETKESYPAKAIKLIIREK